MEKLESKNLMLRLVERSDANFILSLRMDERYNTFILMVTPDIESQVQWIERYKADEQNGKQFYFIIERKDGEPCGTVRIYDLRDDSFSWGSWILNQNKTRFAALESAFLLYQFGFEKLGYRKSHFEVMRGNKGVIKFHQRMGATRVGEDQQNEYFEITKEAVDCARNALAEKIK